jgi:hypothetical protein
MANGTQVSLLLPPTLARKLTLVSNGGKHERGHETWVRGTIPSEVPDEQAYSRLA